MSLKWPGATFSWGGSSDRSPSRVAVTTGRVEATAAARPVEDEVELVDPDPARLEVGLRRSPVAPGGDGQRGQGGQQGLAAGRGDRLADER